VAQSNIDGTTTWAASYQADGRRTAEAGTNLERHRASCLPKATQDAASGLVFHAAFAAGRSKEEDPTGLLNEGFRYRDMETGTFISRDPLGLVDGPNVYCYVRQNPWTMWDPEGLWGIGDSNGPVLDYLWDLGGGVVDGGIEAVEGMGHAVAHPINTAAAVKDGVLAVKDGIGELSSALDGGHVTWGEIGTAYGDGLTEVASDPAKVGKIVGSSAVSLGAGKAAAVGGKLAMAAAVQTNTARTIAAQAGTAFAKGVAQAAKGGGSLWSSRSPGVQVRQFGDWWVKRVNPESKALMRWWGQRSINAQYRGLQALGDMATPHAMRNGNLFTRSVGETLPDGFRLFNSTSRGAYMEGSRRIGTYF